MLNNMNFGSNFKKGSIVIPDSPKVIDGNFKKKQSQQKNKTNKEIEEENFIEIAKKNVQLKSKKRIGTGRNKSKSKNSISENIENDKKKNNRESSSAKGTIIELIKIIRKNFN